ncbi:PEP-CTERM sorting domain-containing protein [Pseudoduganella armeniaca]|uniref:Ice-binding protein C-terminal domain-containing protein n=1 Tax=Pseudoduganella armeniaca TaxID=2072590 RepID=A0A2R4CDX5_9BURK|nr:PEP-CTERM sorting domain-containing protein [Pseudoduganella armeniaca]AVR97847.1 hypothetical protein C9I28_21065 [Pseudoduganella armeniaca]
MKLRSAVSAVTLALVTVCSAQAAVYTYTGNLATFDTINSEPSRIIAHFEFDFENSTMAQYDTYAFKSWDVSYGGMKFSSAAGNALFNRFTFDAGKNVTGWYFDAFDVEYPDHTQNVQSISENFIFFGPNEAHDIAIVKNPLETASVYGNSGTWSIAPSVPEPATYLMLGLGLAAVGFASRKRQG